MIGRNHHILAATVISVMLVLCGGNVKKDVDANDGSVVLQVDFAEEEPGETTGETTAKEEYETLKIVESVQYRNLIPGKRYYIQGRLMQKTPAGPGAVISSTSCSFIPDSGSGTVVLEYTVKAEDYNGQELTSRIQLSRVSTWYPEDPSTGEGQLGPATSRIPVAEDEAPVP